MKFPVYTCTILLCLVISCNETKKEVTDKNLPPLEVNDVTEGSSILQLDTRLIHADSLVFVFYKDPHGKDSLRYTRFYTQFASTDTNLINFVKDNLTDSTIRLEKIKKCRSEGKIWCFSKGDIFQTIYFSSHNNECMFLYIIKNGQFYYSTIRNPLIVKLAAVKSQAKELKNEGYKMK